MEETSEIVEGGDPTSTPQITFADLGIPQAAQLQDTMVGKARRWSDITWKERIYTLVMLLSIGGVLGFTIYRVATVDTSDSDFTFGLVLILNAVFCIIYVIEGILRERPSEVFILSVATTLILIYLIVNYAAGTKEDIKLARLIVACVLCPFLVVAGLGITWQYHVSRQLIFRIVGANETLQVLLRKLLAFQDFLKFDVQLGGSMVILIVTSRLSVDTKDIVILSVGGAFTVAWFILGFFSMAQEYKIGAYIFFLFSPAEVGYIIYKLYDVSDYIDSHSGLAAATIACGAFALAVRVFVILLGVLVFREFGAGLKEKLKGG